MNVLVRKELASMLCIADRTHSSMLDSLPEKLISSVPSKPDVAKLIKKVRFRLTSLLTIPSGSFMVRS